MTSCGVNPDFDASLRSIVQPYRFSILRWQLSHLLPAPQTSPPSGAQASTALSEVDQVLHYFGLVEDIRALERRVETLGAGDATGEVGAAAAVLEARRLEKAALTERVRQILARQVRETLAHEGIFTPLDRFLTVRVTFPPINFKLQPPPHTLIVSPRDRIESIREIMLVQDLSLEAKGQLEAAVDALGVSSLVLELGGFGATYPTFVADDSSLAYTLKTVTEEWLHQYLAFTPLGFLYVLDLTGIRPDYELATINETVAGIVSQEIGDKVLATYYDTAEWEGEPPELTEPQPGFSFNAEMRRIRLAVDELLAAGKIEEAEDFMEERRQYLASQGYYIRKLNQAYFAFYGTYAYEPTSVSPIGGEVRSLRAQARSVRELLNAAAWMTSRADLLRLLGAPGP